MLRLKSPEIPTLLLRIAIAVPYVWFVAGRLDWVGTNGQPHVGWGDWMHFLKYAHQTMRFMADGFVQPLAIGATVGELTLGLLLLMGLFTRWAALCSVVPSLLFALSMSLSFGLEFALGYSVFTLSAASLLLATLPSYGWSLDQYRRQYQPVNQGYSAPVFTCITYLTIHDDHGNHQLHYAQRHYQLETADRTGR